MAPCRDAVNAEIICAVKVILSADTPPWVDWHLWGLFFISFENDDSSYWFEAKHSTMNIASHLNIPNNLDPINLSKADWFK